MGKKYVIWTMVAIHSLHSVSCRLVDSLLAAQISAHNLCTGFEQL